MRGKKKKKKEIKKVQANNCELDIVLTLKKKIILSLKYSFLHETKNLSLHYNTYKCPL